MPIKKSITAFILLLSFTLMGCDRLGSSVSDTEKVETQPVPHEQGVTEVPLNPKKVVVFNPATLDTMDALGIEIIGLPKTSNHLPDFLEQYNDSKYSNVGTLFEPDYEKLSRLAPDLIIAGGRVSDAYEKLSEIAPTISLPIDPTHFMESLTENTMELAFIFHKESIAKTKLMQFKQKIEALRSKIVAQHPTALVVMVNGGKMSAYGAGSRFGFIFDQLGFKPALELPKTGTHGSLMNAELLLKANPDWLFVIDRDTAISNKEALSAKQVLDNPLTHTVKALQNNHVVYVDSTAMYIAGGLQTYFHFMDQLKDRLDDTQADTQ